MNNSNSSMALAPAQLCNKCDPADLAFNDTSELEHLDNFFGQSRAVEALRFGVDIHHEGYNIFVLGPTGIGKHEMVDDFLQRHAKDGELPCDWCYINNFDAPQRPRVLQLPPGKACQLQKDMEHCVEDILIAIPGVFQSTEYKARLSELNEEYSEKEQNAFQELAEKAREHSVALVQTPSGYTLAPIAEDKILTPTEFDALPDDEQERIKKTISSLKEDLKQIVLNLPALMKESRSRLKNLNRDFTENAVNLIFRDLESKYSDLPEVMHFLGNVKKDVIDNVDAFREEDHSGSPENQKNLVKSFPMYLVNVLVDRSGLEGAPVVYENNPSLTNLIGRVEHEAQYGALTTNFMLIRPGALHRANGGYLLLDALKLLSHPFSWEALKRALQARQAKIESADQILSLVSTKSLEPEPVPLDLKVVLLGDRMIYYLLQAHDPDFRTLFKVPADLSEDVERNPDNNFSYARLIAALQARKGTRPFDSSAVARVIEQGSRKLEDASKLSLSLNGLTDLLFESDYFAGRDEAAVVSARHVQSAITAADARLSQFREKTGESILREIQLVDTSGAKVGQINGLSVYQLGEFAFGRPTRITARARLGSGKVLDIEKEVKLGGNIHSKGVMILSSFIASRFARNRPLPISASLVFEQSYGGVDGDSATIAEITALLSAIAAIPIKQSLAVTGSVNQHGQVQAIGGINQKIEGFFDICQARGLNGEHGVVMPAANVQHLMLEQRVIDAVAEGKFHIHAVSDIDAAMSLLMDTEAGAPDGNGAYPPASINGKVVAQIDQWIELGRKFSAHSEGAGNDSGKT
ncbi:AAA family ATPase [Pseudomaricurvus alcaniphilus]|uniref:AAA family ATPase n=1 Tax=Pseudomaricurvus alcaniphilus TaxID=1166482 RepID=UPI001A9F5971